MREEQRSRVGKSREQRDYARKGRFERGKMIMRQEIGMKEKTAVIAAEKERRIHKGSARSVEWSKRSSVWKQYREEKQKEKQRKC